MSDRSLYSGLYRQISDYAELVDDVLVTLLDQGMNPNTEIHKRLGRALQRITVHSKDKVPQPMLVFLFSDSELISDADLASAATALLEGTPDESTREILEHFARLLEQERTRVMAIIRGHLRNCSVEPDASPG